MDLFKERYQYFINHTGKSYKKHQEEGMLWCVSQENVKHPYQSIHGGIIADEMGCGKTLMMISVIICNPLPKTLIILPLALVSQWKNNIYELTGHTPFIYYGNTVKGSDHKLLSNSSPIIITTYGVVAHSISHDHLPNTLFRIHWNRIIFDEAHHMRNTTYKYKAGLALKSEIKWTITGTPIQNKMKDLYNLCKIIGINKSRSIPIDILKQHIIRRTKSDVGIILPPLIIHESSVEWNNDDEKMIASILHKKMTNSICINDNHNNYCEEKNYLRCNNEHEFMYELPTTNYNLPIDIPDSKNYGLSLSNHERLPFISQCEKEFNTSLSIENTFGIHRLVYFIRCKQMCTLPKLLSKLENDSTYDEQSIIKNGLLNTNKIDELVKCIKVNQHNGNKKIVFCTFRKEMDLIKEHLFNAGIYNTCCYDARISRKDRNDIIENKPDVLLLQIKMGCEGLNLQYANEVYFVGPLWNPAMEDQAIARCYRLGQKKPTHVYKYNMCNIEKNVHSIDQYTHFVENGKREIMNCIC